jgi:hypothetical protein
VNWLLGPCRKPLGKLLGKLLGPCKRHLGKHLGKLLGPCRKPLGKLLEACREPLGKRNGSEQAHSTVKMPVRKEASTSIRLPIYTDTPIQINS